MVKEIVFCFFFISVVKNIYWRYHVDLKEAEFCPHVIMIFFSVWVSSSSSSYSVIRIFESKGLVAAGDLPCMFKFTHCQFSVIGFFKILCSHLLITGVGVFQMHLIFVTLPYLFVLITKTGT